MSRPARRAKVVSTVLSSGALLGVSVSLWLHTPEASSTSTANTTLDTSPVDSSLGTAPSATVVAAPTVTSGDDGQQVQANEDGVALAPVDTTAPSLVAPVPAVPAPSVAAAPLPPPTPQHKRHQNPVCSGSRC